MPQQLCIVLYLIGWYDREGLKCQRCLFDQQACAAESPFHAGNTLPLVFTLTSCLLNQLLWRPMKTKTYSDDDICCQRLLRFGMACVQILPFTGGIWFASGSILAAPMLLHSIVL